MALLSSLVPILVRIHQFKSYIYLILLAQAARVQAQYQRIERREILVMFTSERQKLVQEGKIYVKNISSSVSVSDLHNYFARISQQLFVHINTDDKGNRLNFGFAHYLNVEDANVALAVLQDSQFCGQKLHISRWVVKETRQIAQNESRRNLYIRNLPLAKKKSVENSLKQLLLPYGAIESMLIKKANKLNTFYALVSFKEHQAAQSAVEGLTASPICLEGTTEPLFVSWYQRKCERKTVPQQQNNSVYLNGLKHNVTGKDLRKIFKAYGLISQVFLTTSEDSRNSVGAKCGYIVFEEDTSAEKALSEHQENVVVKDLFINEPQIKLQTKPSDSTIQNKPKRQRRGASERMSSPPNDDSSFPYWPIPGPYVNNMFQGVYPPYMPMGYYPPVMSTPTGYGPIFTQNLYVMPQENILEPNDYLYLANDYSYDFEFTERNMSSRILDNCCGEDQETRPQSVGSLSALDGDHLEDSGPADSHVSTDGSETLEMESKKPQEQTIRVEEDKSKEQAREQKCALSYDKPKCRPKRKYEKCLPQRESQYVNGNVH